MAIDRQGLGLTLLRICIGVFFIFEGLGKIRWFTDTSILAGRFAEWSHAAAAGSISQWYLQRIAQPGLSIFARLVPLGEICSGLALVIGLWTPLFAFIAFFMALNFHLAGGTLFKYSFLTNAYGLPVLGSTLALAIGGVRKGKSQKSKVKS
jgi:uncharacterized membrane protein YphA (DoxX/SURF4 family)